MRHTKRWLSSSALISAGVIALGLTRASSPALAGEAELSRQGTLPFSREEINEELARRHFIKGLEQRKKGDFDAAVASFKEAIRYKPEDALTYYHLGRAYYKNGQLDAAVGSFKEAIRLKPDLISPHYYLIDTYQGIGKYEAALLAIDHFIRQQKISIPSKFEKFSEDILALIMSINKELNRIYFQKRVVEKVKEEPHLSDLQLKWLIRIEDFLVEAAGHYRSAETMLLFEEAATLKGTTDVEYTKMFKQQAFLKFLEQNAKAKKLHEKAGRDLKTLLVRMQVRKEREIQKVSSSQGTGYFISRDGHILTNYHVIKGASAIVITTLDEKTYKATVLSKDKANDLALLKIPSEHPHDFPPLFLADSNKVEKGDEVFTLGFPVSQLLGNEARLAKGIIAALHGPDDDPRFFQISVPVQPGNSGGPLFNQDGQVVGVVVAQIDAVKFFKITGSLPQNINFAVKINYAKPFLAMNPQLGSRRSALTVSESQTRTLSKLTKDMEKAVVLIKAK